MTTFDGALGWEAVIVLCCWRQWFGFRCLLVFLDMVEMAFDHGIFCRGMFSECSTGKASDIEEMTSIELALAGG